MGSGPGGILGVTQFVADPRQHPKRSALLQAIETLRGSIRHAQRDASRAKRSQRRRQEAGGGGAPGARQTRRHAQRTRQRSRSFGRRGSSRTWDLAPRKTTSPLERLPRGPRVSRRFRAMGAARRAGGRANRHRERRAATPRTIRPLACNGSIQRSRARAGRRGCRGYDAVGRPLAAGGAHPPAARRRANGNAAYEHHGPRRFRDPRDSRPRAARMPPRRSPDSYPRDRRARWCRARSGRVVGTGALWVPSGGAGGRRLFAHRAGRQGVAEIAQSRSRQRSSEIRRPSSGAGAGRARSSPVSRPVR